MAVSIVAKAEKFFNKFEKSDAYNELLDGTLGLHPAFFDKVKLADNLTMYTDVNVNKTRTKFVLSIMVSLKYRKDCERFSSYKVVAETEVEISDDMAEYFKDAKNAAIKLAKDVMEKGF